MFVPGMMGRFIGEYTTAQCGYLFATVGGGLTVKLTSTVLSSATFLLDTDLSNAVSLLDENIQKLRLLQGDLEEVKKKAEDNLVFTAIVWIGVDLHLLHL